MSAVIVELDLPEAMKKEAQEANLLNSKAIERLIAKELQALHDPNYLAELEEAKWDALFEKSSDLLDAWAEEALAEHKAGNTIAVDRKDR